MIYYGEDWLSVLGTGVSTAGGVVSTFFKTEAEKEAEKQETARTRILAASTGGDTVKKPAIPASVIYVAVGGVVLLAVVMAWKK